MRTRFLICSIVALFLAGCGPRSSKSALDGPGASMVAPVQSVPWETGSGGGRELTSAHYRIYTNASNATLVRYMPGFLEAAYRNYSELTGLDSPTAEPMAVYLMNSRNDWTSLTRHVIGPQAGPYLSIQSGGYCYRGVCVFWDIGNLATFSIASHEGLHQFLHHRLRQGIPIWMEEGLATLSEGYHVEGERVWFTPERNLFRFRDLRVAIVEGHWMDLDRLLGSQPSDLLGGEQNRTVGYYGQVWALMSYIRSQDAYREGFLRLMRDASQGKLMVKAAGGRGSARSKEVAVGLLRQYIAPDLAAFERGYRAHARELVGLE